MADVPGPVVSKELVNVDGDGPGLVARVIGVDTGQPMQLFASVNPQTGEQGPDEAWERGIGPIRGFMSQQIYAAGNTDDVFLLLEYLPESELKADDAYEDFDDVPLQVLEAHVDGGEAHVDDVIAKAPNPDDPESGPAVRLKANGVGGELFVRR